MIGQLSVIGGHPQGGVSANFQYSEVSEVSMIGGQYFVNVFVRSWPLEVDHVKKSFD